jgi:ligand-binding SRPBCC domain-containing protein
MTTSRKEFRYSTFMPTSLEIMTRFHEEPNALKILTPPPLLVQLLSDQRHSNTEGIVDFVLWFGPLPVRWIARHEPGPIPTSFIDRMIEGPMADWEHQHIFHEAAGSVILEDKVTYAHKSGWQGWLTQLLFDGLPLRVLFWYRHWRTQRECRKLMLLADS